MSARVSSGLRFGFSRHCSVVISVPSPSTVIEPPSSTIDDGRRSKPSASATRSVTAASLSYGRKRSPHELKRKSTAVTDPPAPTAKIGPESRIHESSIGSSRTSTPAASTALASRPAPGAATITTGSNALIAFATAAYSATASSNTSPHNARRVGHAIRHA